MGAIKWFKDISSADVGSCGGKGASLGELMKAGFPFVDGFVLTIEAFGKNYKDWADTVYKAYDQLNTQYVAVRSSATKEDGVDDSFAGQFDTYLFVNRETLIEQIMECHKSINSDRIIAYCDSKGINRSDIKVAVVVQKMVNSEVAGVAFTVNPVNNNRDEIMIEGGFGLGEAVVSGMITPDNYIWNKAKQTITDKTISHQTKKLVLDMHKGGTIEESVESTTQEIQKLSDKHITELAKLAEKIEQHYGKPMDIEWALEDNRLYILQARPITTLNTLSPNSSSSIPREKVLQRNFPPFAYTTGAYYEFHGINLGPVHWKRDREIMATYDVPQFFIIQDPRAYYTTNVGEIIQTINADFETSVDQYNQEIYKAVRIEPGNSYDDLVALSEIHKLCYGLMLMGFDLAIDIKSCIDKFMSDQSEAFLGFLETPIQKTAIQREQDAVRMIIENQQTSDTKSIEKLAYDFGYIHQDYLGEPWTVEEYRELFAQHNTLTSHMDESYDISHLSDHQQWLIRMFKKMVYMYEEGRNAMVRCMRAINETSKKLSIDTDKILSMTVSEFEEMCHRQDTSLMISDELLAKRKEGFVAHFDNGIYTEYTGGKDVEKFLSEAGIMHFWDKKNIAVDELKGTVAFPGYAIGRARLVWDQKDANAVQEGEILISPMTQVEFLGGMRKCAAIVTDEGGIICHAAIVSREFGKPCILATKDATSAIKNGDLVEVDANMGVVRIVEKLQDTLLSKKWKKNRAGWWSLLSCHYFGNHYTRSLQEKVGISLEECVLIINQGYSACYFLEEYKKAFGMHFARMAVKDKTLPQEWSDKLMENTDIMLSTIKRLMQKEFEKQDMDVFLESFYNYSMYHRIIKVSVDYLDVDILEKYLTLLEKARIYAEPVYENTEVYMKWVADALGKKYDIAPELVLATNPEQFADILDGKLPDTNVLQNQYGNSILYIQQGKVQHISGSSAKEFERKLTAKNEAQETISGQAAYPGKVQGRVRIVLDPQSDTVFERGEILVTGMTRPEYLPLVEKSAAFVTDAGGILSHAAITARELKKPCVIGTEIASKILKDGDFVEVDADNGTVKIVEQKDPIKDTTYILYDHKKWKPFITRNMSFWHQRLGVQGYALHAKDFGIEQPNVVFSLCIDGTHTILFSNEENIQLFGDAILKAVSTKAKIQKLKEKYYTFAEDLIASLEVLHKKLDTANREQFTNNYKRFTAGLQITATLGRAGVTRLMEKLQKIGYNSQELPEIINTITYPDQHTPLFQSQYDLLSIARDIQNKKVTKIQIQQKLRTWFDANCYIPVNFCDDSWSMDDIQKQLDGLLTKDCVQELALLDKQHNQQLMNKKQRLKKINNKEISILAQAIAEGTILNEFRKNTFSKVSLGYRPIFTKIAHMAGSQSRKDCFYLTSDEITQILEGNKVDIISLIAARKKVAFGVNEQGEIIFCNEEETQNIYNFVQNLQGKNFDTTQNSSQTKIHGYSASKGILQGTAKIILSSKDFHKINTGDILITTMTSVDFVPVMEKAGAFVTNEGGVTSHASIVAREMNKPCIIGTQNATQVLHDGDWIEVDATNGIVKIVEKFDNKKDSNTIWADYIGQKLRHMGTRGGIYPLDIGTRYPVEVMGKLYKLFGAYSSSAVICDCREEIPTQRVFLKQNGLDAFTARLNDIRKNDPQGFTKILSSVYDTLEDVKQYFLSQDTNNISDASNEELAQYFIDYRNQVHKLSIYDQVVWRNEPYLDKQLHEHIQSLGLQPNTQEYNNLLFALIIPRRPSTVMEEEQSVVTYAQAIQQGKTSLEQAAVILAEKFGWLPAFVSGDEWGADHYLAILEKYVAKSSTELAAESKKYFDHTTSTQALVEKYTKQYDIPATVLQICRDYALAIDSRNEAEYHLGFARRYLRPVCHEIAQRLGVTEEELRLLYQDEISECIRGEKNIYDILATRKGTYTAYCYDADTQQSYTFDGDSAKEFLEYCQSTQQTKKKSTHVAASTGVAQGKVKIVHGPYENDKVKPGDILITQSTTVDYLPAMKICGAIITEVGGLTCHAAVVARELGIPCIVSYAGAMTEFKDGDIIEVNADNDTISILEKSAS